MELYHTDDGQPSRNCIPSMISTISYIYTFVDLKTAIPKKNQIYIKLNVITNKNNSSKADNEHKNNNWMGQVM